MREVTAGLAAIGGRRFKRYPVYKDSGVEWLGAIPAHWEVSRLSGLATLLNGYPFDSQYFVRGDGVPLVRIRDLLSTETEVNYTGPLVESAWIEPNDLIIGMDGDFNVARWRGRRALLNQRMCCLRPLRETDGAFLAYVLPFPLRVMNDLTYSTTVKHLSSVDIRKIRLGAPQRAEQHAISSFLAREIGTIDTLLAKKERLIELLREKRTAFIARAMTKGLDPSVPLKDSGVAGLADIPAHWQAKRLKYVVPGLTVGIVVTPAKYYEVSGVPCLRSLNVASGQIVLDDLVFMSDASNEVHAKSKLRAGDLVVVRTGLTGTAAVVTSDLDGVNCIDLLIVRRSNTVRSKFLWYYINSRAAATQIAEYSEGAIQAHYNTSTLGDLMITLPPAAEQEAIESRLEAETARLDALIAAVRGAIERLMELRTALISAAVTGKIDVRDT